MDLMDQSRGPNAYLHQPVTLPRPSGAYLA
eukprot:COSAG06_NODE_2908_length_6105_cov_9.949384_5_plen_29_part_01